MPTTISNTITTDHADLISFDAKRTGQIPPMYVDRLTGRIVADVSLESRDAFQADIDLQRYLSAKTAIWRIISKMRNRRQS